MQVADDRVEDKTFFFSSRQQIQELEATLYNALQQDKVIHITRYLQTFLWKLIPKQYKLFNYVAEVLSNYVIRLEKGQEMRHKQSILICFWQRGFRGT